ncbi:phosphomannomutase [Novosphingobium kunmingense]|uniref:Phosphomannomutase n=1 Tax=Novosphingobium kunmingense TaxID=1211806 RepID=A0A2N0H5G6_9SPHN|nr:phosphomannomutase/phosphoglucomutase [Novosphingobium kunmingense]PKB14201.1 phosphomannomutase [Novosphingobium kunmingense]
MKAHRFDPTILREYDIRGQVGSQLGANDAHALGRGFATVVRGAGGSAVAVGRDGRLSSPMLEAALVDGLTAGGVNVVRIGLGPTPMLYYTEATLDEVQGGIQVTGSHNPADHNGFKIVHDGAPFCGAELRRLGDRAKAGDWSSGAGRVRELAIEQAYVERLLRALDGLDQAKLGALRIGWDAGSGAAGPALERLVARLPGQHHTLFTHVDGTFPHHHPDPTVEANLADLKALVVTKSLDFGVALDGDGDRIVVVDAKGRVLLGDQLLMILAQDLLQRAPGSPIIADVKASQSLFDAIARFGGRAVMGKTGHSLIKSEMKRIGAPLGGEMTGHLMFADDWYGFDDALYAALRLIAASQRLGLSLTALRDAMPEPFNTPELRVPVDEASKFAVVEEVARRLARDEADVVTIDGVRVSTPDGWWLLRASNTQDVLVLRAESDTRDGLERLLAEADARLAEAGIARR